MTFLEIFNSTRLHFSQFSQNFVSRLMTWFLGLCHLFLKKNNNVVFTGVFTCQCVACEDTGRAAYSQLRLHVNGKYNHQQDDGISCQYHRNVACRPVYMQWVSLVLAHALAKVRNFVHVASKMQHVHATVISHLHERY